LPPRLVLRPDATDVEAMLPTPARCPKCGARAAVPIAYGEPGPELVEDAKAGRVVLGGCVIDDDSPTHACVDCGNRWTPAGVRRRTRPE
jgi:hypothetical protein